jgi:archaellum component FlaD/FlaE
MVDEMGDSKNTNSEEIDIKKELLALSKENVIPKKIADKLGEKLESKQVKLTKEQIRLLATKINDMINNYRKTGTLNNKGYAAQTGSDENMQKLIETIEKLEERITNMESGKTSYEKPTRYVTTDDIQVHGWDIDPLTMIPNDPESVIVLMKWLQYLIDKCGHSHLLEILDYYVDIGWISDDAKISLLDYSAGITEEGKKGDTLRKGVSNLPSKDHIQSLMFIQKLKGYQFDKHFLDRVEGELFRMTKKLDSYRFK